MREPAFTLTAGPVKATDRTQRELARPIIYDYDRVFISFYRQTAEKLADGAEVAQAALDAWGNALANDLPPQEAIASFTRAWTQLYLVRQQIERGKETNDAEH